jgi:hypothetical protein
MLSVICASSALFVFVQQQYLSHSHESLPSGRQHHAAGENSGIGRNSVSDSHDITDVHGLSFVGVSIHKEAEQRTMYGKLRDTQQLSQSSVVLLKTFRSKTRKMKDGRHRKLSHRQRQKAARRMTQMEQPLVIAAAESKSPSVNAISQETLVDNRTLFQTYRMSHPYPGVLSVHVTGNISYRLKQFNVAVDQLRLQLWNELNAADTSEHKSVIDI